VSEEPPPPQQPWRSKLPGRAGGQVPTLLQALNNGFEGIIWVLRTQRNMRVHFLAGAGALVLAVVLGVSRVDLLAVILAIAIVLVAEMINTALEAAVDLAQPDPHPLAKVAKDVAAGGVLISAACSLAIGYLVFADRLSHPSGHAIHRVRSSSPDLTLIALLLVVLAVIAGKAVSHRGTPMSGGLPSGHAAVAFAGFTAIVLSTGDNPHHVLIASLALLMALLVAQTRVEAGVHTVSEVVLGGVLGLAVTLLVFQLVR
jgi:diacylglycerol kinase (ATP)